MKQKRERECAHELISKHSFFTVNCIVHQLSIGSSFGSVFDRYEVAEKKKIAQFEMASQGATISDDVSICVVQV